MNKITIWIIVIVVVIIGAIFLFSRPSEAPTEEMLPTESPATTVLPPEAASHTVVYTTSGYSPSEVTIRAGDTVIFKNESQLGMRTASAVHPTHKAYPGSGIEKCGTAEAANIFDACTGIAPGGDWSFTFTQKGTWGYHNHLQTSHRGRIIVE